MVDGMPLWFVALGLVGMVSAVYTCWSLFLLVLRTAIAACDAVSSAIFDYRVRKGDIPRPYRAFYNKE